MVERLAAGGLKQALCAMASTKASKLSCYVKQEVLKRESDCVEVH